MQSVLWLLSGLGNLLVMRQEACYCRMERRMEEIVGYWSSSPIIRISSLILFLCPYCSHETSCPIRNKHNSTTEAELNGGKGLRSTMAHSV